MSPERPANHKERSRRSTESVQTITQRSYDGRKLRLVVQNHAALWGSWTTIGDFPNHLMLSLCKALEEAIPKEVNEGRKIISAGMEVENWPEIETTIQKAIASKDFSRCSFVMKLNPRSTTERYRLRNINVSIDFPRHVDPDETIVARNEKDDKGIDAMVDAYATAITHAAESSGARVRKLRDS